MLTVTDYKPYKRAVRGRVGVRADFRVKPVPKEGVVYQKVTSKGGTLITSPRPRSSPLLHVREDLR